MKTREELYEALEKAERAAFRENIRGMIGDLEQISDVISEEAETAETRLPTALHVVRHYADWAAAVATDLRIATEKVLKEICTGLQEPEAVEASGSEDKEKIVASLEDTLRNTRAGEDIAGMTYVKDGELVEIRFTNGSPQPVNVGCDSGLAMIIDVCKALM